jgi:hypothetical protein
LVKIENRAIDKLTKECGSVATAKLVNLMADFQKATDQKETYNKTPRRARDEKPSGFCEFIVLTQGKWPIKHHPGEFTVPRQLCADQKMFSDHYLQKNVKTKLMWNYHASSCLMNVIESKKVVSELSCSFFQGLILI